MNGSAPIEWWSDPSIARLLGDDPKESTSAWPLKQAAVGFTGFGPDGVNQPSNPVAVVQTPTGPVALHEGEPVIQQPDGSQRIVSQDEMQRIIQARAIPGMQSGGTLPGLNSTAGAGIVATIEPEMKDVTKGARAAPTYSGGTSSVTSPLMSPTIGSEEEEKAPDYYGEGMTYLRDVMQGKNATQRAIADRAVMQQGLINKAQQGANAQKAAAAGFGAEDIASMQAVTARDAAGQQSKLQGQLAEGAQQQAQSAAQIVASQGWTQKVYEDEQARTAVSDSESAAADSITSSFAADPNLRTSWESNTGVVASLKAQWDANPALNQGRPFDLRVPEVKNWAQGRVNALTVTPTDTAINTIRGSSWYQALPPADKTKWETEIFPALSVVASTGGKLEFTRDDKGNITGWSLNDATTGESIMSSEGYSGAATTNDWVTPAGRAKAYTGWTDSVEMGDSYSSESGLTAYANAHDGEVPASASQYTTWQIRDRVYSTDEPADFADAQETALDMGIGIDDMGRLKEYLDANGGKMPRSKAAFDSWSQTAGSRTAVSSWLSGTGTLTPQASAALPDMLKDGTIPAASSYTFDASGVTYNNPMTTTDGQFSLSTAALSWAAANKGKTIAIGGKQYVVDPESQTQAYKYVDIGTRRNPLTGKTWKHDANVQGIRLIGSDGKAYLYVPVVNGGDADQLDGEMFSTSGKWQLVPAPEQEIEAGTTEE